MKRHRTVFDHLHDWWWLYGVLATLCSLLVLWGSIPTRLAHAEEELNDLKDWAKELQGYTRAQQEFNAQQRQMAPVVHEQEWQDDQGTWWCCNPNRDDCQQNTVWRRCD